MKIQLAIAICEIIYLTIKSTRLYLMETYPTQNFVQIVTPD